ncbi:MAG: hypothetical protein AMJ54_02295 [Deltaproteobacteria bacterium SG8_13]|nr:MAG: hypothetical protein AMJ54_02295 [Deltaproteobacteria bacterium SG8_13]
MWNRLASQPPACRSGLAAILLIAAAAALVFACSGAAVKPEQRIPLAADAPYASEVKTTDYSMEYELVYKPAGASGGGTLQFNGKLVPRRGLDSMTIWINFLDAEGKTIGSKTLYSPGAGRGAARTSLEQTFEVPPDAVSVAFTHIAREKRPILLD